MATEASVAEFWKGDFGNNYTRRIVGENLIGEREAFYRLALGGADQPIKSVIEFGANRGLNLLALQRIIDARMTAVEINELALSELSNVGGVHVIQSNMLEFQGQDQYDLSLSMAVLMHIPPEALPQAYGALYHSSRRYVLIAEYYNPKPELIEFQGRNDLLWKRDFAGEMLDLYPDLKVIDYGFLWRRDPVMPLYDLTWFLMEKH